MIAKKFDDSLDLCEIAINNLDNNKDKIAFVFTHDFINSFNRAMLKFNISDIIWNTKYNTLVRKNPYIHTLSSYHRDILKEYFKLDYSVYNYIIKNFY